MLKLNKLTNNSIIQRKSDIESTDLDDDKVMMDLDNGKYFMLNPVANDIWEKIVSPISVSDLINKLLSQYSIDEKTCYLNVISFLSELNDNNLLLIC